MKRRVPRTRAGGRWTEGQYNGFVRSLLRKKWLQWPVRRDALLDARRANKSDNKRLKWEYECRKCLEWFPEKEVEVDHIVECGSMKDMNLFVSRLYCEIDNLQVLCKTCHKEKKHG